MQTGNRPRPGCRRGIVIAFGCACALALAACHHAAPPPPSNVTPDKAVMTNLRLTATGDFDGLMRNRLPPAEFARWRQEWDKQHAHPVPASVAQQQQFANIMQLLTEPGAEDKLARRLQPTLTRLRRKDKAMPILGGILEAAGKQMIANAPQLGSAQRKLVAQAFDAWIAWANTADFGDPKKAGKVIDIACATARKLHVQTLAQWRALDYATTMRDYGIIWNGLESALNVYGLDLAKALNDAKVDSTSQGGNRATVKLDISFAGKQLTAQWPMVQQQGHWYDEALLEAWRKAHPAPVSGASAAPAGTAGFTAPAATTGARPAATITPAPSRS